jgi:hypothetical protein
MKQRLAAEEYSSLCWKGKAQDFLKQIRCNFTVRRSASEMIDNHKTCV